MGEIFGKYELIRKIATGGMAEVFLAEQRTDLGGFVKRVAIKRMFPHLADSEDATNMFLDEARIAATFNHPNIVQIYELGREGENFYLAMEFVDGRDLRRILDRARELDNPLPLNLAVYIVGKVAEGLHYAHTATDDAGKLMHVVHRDVSPQNVLVSRTGHVKVCDFGIARAEDRLQHTKQGQFKGKICYMSPEQFETSEVDHRSDIYSMGVLLYEATTGRRVYDADTDVEVMRMMAIGDIKTPSELVPGYPQDLEAIVLTCLQKNPADRFPTAESLYLALDSWLDSTASRPGTLHLARFMRTLFPDMNSDEPIVHDDTTLVTEPAAPYADDFSNISEEEEEATVIIDQSQRWKEEDQSVIITENYQTAEMNAFQREALKQASSPLERSVELPAFSAIPKSRPQPEPVEPQVLQPQAPKPAPVAPAPKPAPAPPPPQSVTITTPSKPLLNLAVPRVGAVAQPPTAPSVNPSRAPQPAHAAGPPVNIVPPLAAKRAQPPEAQHEPPESDASFEGYLPKRKLSTVLVPPAFILLIVVCAVAFYVQTHRESDLEKAAMATNIDEKLLEDVTIPPPPTVEVAFQSDPEKASFLVNGLPAQTNGGKLVLRKGKRNQVTAMLEGYEFAAMEVAGQAGGPFTIKLENQRATGATSKYASLAIVSEPMDASVWLDGKEVGRTPLTLNDLSADSEHYVYMTKDDHFPYAGFIGLVPGSENEVHVELARRDSARRHYVEAIYSAIPRMTIVTIDGERIGATPMRKNFERGQLVEVELDEPDHAPQNYIIDMSEVGTFELRPYLREMKREKGTIGVRFEPAGAALYVGASGYGTGPIKRLELKEGSYPVVAEVNGARLRGTLKVEPNKHVDYVLRAQNGALVITAN